ncbi:DUF2256 domain-containing protein [Yoonia sp. MH D7]
MKNYTRSVPTLTDFSKKSRHMKKANLPQKTCPVCMRPFSWRKKWEKVWDDVRYCSAKCSNTRKSTKK